jgi:hypothetical protein
MGEKTVQNAQEVRSHHRKRTDRADRQRNDDLNLALARVKGAMKPLRSEIGRFPKYPKTTDNAERKRVIRDASLSLQKERRKLWKMLDRSSKERPS